VGGTLASQAYRDQLIQAFPALGWLSPGSTTIAPVSSVTAADLQEQLKPLAADLALVRRSVELLGSNLDQIAHKQDQLAQNMATLQAAEQEVRQKVSVPPPTPKVVSAPPPPKLEQIPVDFTRSLRA
jgi:septal ring factor EnvC (AmiA/AmiB activator)